jgi:hypothetical protein
MIMFLGSALWAQNTSLCQPLDIVVSQHWQKRVTDPDFNKHDSTQGQQQGSQHQATQPSKTTRSSKTNSTQDL